ncbi:hypothetical protein [Nitrosospira lacus]|uniref:Conjugal transfer protein TraH n=1 Tax=Nitrosospira lacus TaxID=1288494 RepID=A0A1W6SSS5_9PROT|nr:hypothetical protein [Nitrosospira lacus]
MNAPTEAQLQAQLDCLIEEAGLSGEGALSLPPLPYTDPNTDPNTHPNTHDSISHTLHGLEASRRPKVRTVCEECANSVWFTTPTEVKCYCRVMFLVTWESAVPQSITACDGMYLNREE